MPTIILWGPPCSGKSTYIKQRATRHDLIIDLDRLALALVTDDTPHHAYPQVARDAALLARKAIIDPIARWGVNQTNKTAWIIDSNANQQQRARWKQLGAQIIKLDTPYDECVRRAIKDRPAHVISYIDNWFATHA